DATDHKLRLMAWYATEPLAMLDTARAVKLATASKLPRLREFITRRMVAGASGNATPLPAPKVEPAKSVPSTGLALWLKPKSGEVVDASEGGRKISTHPRVVDGIGGRSGAKFNGTDA